MKSLFELEKFKGKKYLILDGGLSTYLEDNGVSFTTKLWSSFCLLDNPNAIKKAHLDFLNSGSDIIQTCTYQFSYEGFSELKVNDEKCDELLSLAVKICQESIHESKKNAIIAASLGPYGAFLADGSEFTGNYADVMSKDDLKKWHLNRVKHISSIPEVDVIAFETFPCAIEAIAVSELLIEENINKPAWISFSCKDGSTLNHGEKIREIIKLLDNNPHIIGFGVNCTSPIYILDLINEIKENTSKDIIVYPNRGEEWDSKNHKWKPLDENSPKLEDLCVQWFDAGARIIGGCCRCTPDDIIKIKNSLRNHVG